MVLNAELSQEAPQHAEALVALELCRSQRRALLICRRLHDRRVCRDRHGSHHRQRVLFRRRDGLLPRKSRALDLQPAPRCVRGLLCLSGAPLLERGVEFPLSFPGLQVRLRCSESKFGVLELRPLLRQLPLPCVRSHRALQRLRGKKRGAGDCSS